MTSYRRPLLMIALALVLPALTFIALQAAFGFRTQKAAVEEAARYRAQRMIDRADARVGRTVLALRILGTVHAIDERDWRGVATRARQFIALNPDWRSISMTDLDRGAPLFDTASPPAPSAADAPPPTGVAIGGMDPVCGCLRVVATVDRGGRPRYLLVARLDPRTFQKLLMPLTPPGELTGLVDRQGRFIARSLDFERRVGTPGSAYLRAAVARGGVGIYSAVTLEGVSVYTAYATSALTGWSAHFAVSSASIDSPTASGNLAIAAAAAISLALVGALAWLAFRDLADQRRALERTQQAQKLEAVGRLSGGIAHDFNNMLAIIIGSLDLARRRLAAGRTDVGRHLDAAAEGARRAADLTRRMLVFSRQQPLAPTVLDVETLLRDLDAMIERSLGPGIGVEWRFGRDLASVRADAGQLENAIVNLAINARDAMPEGGTLTVAAANDGPNVRISVTDTGVGMTQAVAARAFEPFFSTKDVGRGTGLGLSQLYGFAEQSGGRAEIVSAPGQGTTVSILLPRHDAPPDAAPAPAASPASGLGEHVLVVEDEAHVRHAAVEALTELGYAVSEAGDGAAALALLADGLRVDLLFTDVLMPGMTGRDLARRAHGLRADLRVLFTTGYEGAAEPGGGEAMLRKPYSIDDLARAVRAALATSPPLAT